MDTATGELSTDELRRDIAARREDLGRDLDAIGDRLSPGRMVDRTRGRARMRVVAVRDRVMGQARTTRGAVDDAKRQLGSGGVAIIGVLEEGKAGLVVGVTDDLTQTYNAVELARAGAEALGGTGGGGRCAGGGRRQAPALRPAINQ